ncbi:MAG: TolC family protein [Xanthomonadaceae bacterium]|jgi:cobalt-zinc-cadmium efflux system outer membrane protein|nr:TolC family protein [Xanthomonadaceae bacterium]
MRASPSLIVVLVLLLVSARPAAALSLTEAEHAMIEHNPDIRAAAIELRGSEGDWLIASRRPPAELSIDTAKISTLEGIGPGRWSDKRVDSTVGVNWVWERGGKRRWRMQEAYWLREAAQQAFYDSTRLQHLALYESYFGLKASAELLQIAQDNRATADRGLEAADRELASGNIAPVEHARLSVEAMRLAEEARTAEQEHRQAQHALALLIGFDGDPLTLHAEDDWPVLGSNDPIADRTALERRADLREASARVEAADAARTLARSQRYRDVSFGTGVEREPASIAGVTWGLTVSVPLVGAKYYRGEVVRAEADYDVAVLTRRRLRAEALSELGQTRDLLTTSMQRRQRYEQAVVPAARRAIDGVELAYRRGAANLTDLLEARRTWRETSAELVLARAEHAAALARWRATALSSDDGGSIP